MCNFYLGFHLVTFTEYISTLLLPYTNIRRVKISALTGLHADHVGAHQYMMLVLDPYSHRPSLDIYYFLPRDSAVLHGGWILLSKCSSLTGRKCISNNYWFPCTPSRETENVTMHLQIVRSLSFLFAHKYTHTHFVRVTLCVCYCMCALPLMDSHTFVQYLHLLCSGERNLSWCKTFHWLFKRTKQIIPVLAAILCWCYRWLQN